MPHHTTPHPSHAAPSSWITITLIGGPHDGQRMRVPADQSRVELIEAGTRHVYLRVGLRPVLVHERAVARMLGGGAR